MEEGKSKAVPNATLVAAINRIAEKHKNAQKVIFEIRGPFSTYFMVETFTDKRIRTKNLLIGAIKKVGGIVGDAGFAAHAFNYIGVVCVPVKQSKADLIENDAFELAIEAGAEEVQSAFDEENNPAFQFLCELQSLHKVKKAIEDQGITVSTAQLEYVPHTFSIVAPDDLQTISDFIDKIEEIEEVVHVYSNVKDASES